MAIEVLEHLPDPEQAMRESEARYRLLIDHAPDAIVVLDADLGCFIDVNENAERLFGLDREHLLRRVTLDLTGLPPTPAESAAFVADSSPDAYAKLLDRLLASPAYGERWGRHWLDLVRYAETYGHEFDPKLRGLVLKMAEQARESAAGAAGDLLADTVTAPVERGERDDHRGRALQG